MKTLCFVDENLKIATTSSRAEAFAYVLNNNVIEVIFITPLAHYVTRTEAILIISKWKQKNFPHYHAALPEFETCHFVNENVSSSKRPVFADCHVLNSNQKVNNKQLTKLDSSGSPVETTLNDMVMNVYGSLLIDILEFKRLNPKFNPEDYT